jgi:Dimerisation domain of Zinc Transporter
MNSEHLGHQAVDVSTHVCQKHEYVCAIIPGRQGRLDGVDSSTDPLDAGDVDRKISVSQGQGIAHEAEDTVLRSAPRVAEVLVHVEPDDKDHLAKLRGI